MPFTPFHFGLGALAKAVAPKHFSFAGFALSQVLMDVEPGYKMLTNSASDLHIITHNMTGASVIAVGSYAVWRMWETFRPARYVQPLISKTVLLGSCAFGTFSHVFLDGMYHIDMGLPQAHWAISKASVNGLSGTEALCVGFLIAGLIVAAIRYTFNQRKRGVK